MGYGHNRIFKIQMWNDVKMFPTGLLWLRKYRQCGYPWLSAHSVHHWIVKVTLKPTVAGSFHPKCSMTKSKTHENRSDRSDTDQIPGFCHMSIGSIWIMWWISEGMSSIPADSCWASDKVTEEGQVVPFQKRKRAKKRPIHRGDMFEHEFDVT